MLKSLEQMVKSAANTFEIVGTARSGREAIEKVNTHRPDILITDIKMPGINGLEAIRQIKSILPDIHCIILSAFDYFEYATEAVGLGVDDYLLKPVKENLFHIALNRAVENVKVMRNKLSADLKLRESLELMRPILESGFFHALRSYEETPEDLTLFSRLLNDEAYGGYAMTFAFQDKALDPSKSDIKRSVDNKDAYSHISEILLTTNPDLISTLVGNRLFVFKFIKEAISTFDQKLDAESICTALIAKGHNFPFYIYAGVGQYYADLISCKRSYVDSLQALQQALKLKASSHFFHIHDLQSVEGSGIHHNQWQEEQIFAEVSFGRMDSALFAFDEWFKDAKLQSQNNLESLKGQLIALMVGFGKFRNALNANFYTELSTLLVCESTEELKNISSQMIRSLSQLIPSLKQKQISALIQKAEAYLSAHFEEDLSLEEISKVVNLSPFYFSRLYKDETGKNFINRLIEIRIDHAKHYLLQTDIPIKELSTKVGYSDSNYFSKLFKKTTGYTPTDYKECFRK
jgi:two-component system response regulator YesN